MHRIFPRRFVYAAVVLLAAVLMVFVAREYRLVPQALFIWQTFWHPQDIQSLRLESYRVVIEAQVIEGLEDNVSALSYDPDRKSLFTVTNKDSELVELSLDGRILRRIPLTGFGDAEAVEYISTGTYVISDEHQQRLIKVHVDEHTLTLDAANSQQLSLGQDAGTNNGFEGLAYDTKGQRLFVAKERRPMRIIEIRGFPNASTDTPRVIEVASDHKRDARLFVRDLSSLQYDERSGHLLALSHESRQIIELNTDGWPIGRASLSKGALGLRSSVPQAEGIAMDDDGTLYMVSEPNLFYVFKKPAS